MKIPEVSTPTLKGTVVQKDHLIPDPYKRVAQSMESQFAQLMLEQMEKTVDRNEENSSADDYYQSLMRSQQADKMTSVSGGLGLQKEILNQIYPLRMRTENNYNAYLNSEENKFRNHGPIKQKL